MSDATLFGRAVIDRLTALEVSLFGGVANYSDITNFERAVLARIGALEVQKFGSVTVEPDITSFTRAVLDRLTALEGAGGGGGGGGAGTLAAPTLGYPSPIASNPFSIAVHIPVDWQSADALKLAYSASSAMTSPTVLSHTINDTDITNGNATISIPTLAAETYFQAYGNHSGADSGNLSNIVAWGDTTAPTITTSATQSITETSPLAVALAATDSGGVPALLSDGTSPGWYISGGADQLEFQLTIAAGVPTLQWISNGSQSVATPLDQTLASTYQIAITAVDYSGNKSTPLAMTVTVTAIDQTPDAISFTNVNSAPLSTVETSNTVTLSGLQPGFNIPASLSGTGFTYSKNGGAYQSPGSFTVQNGDTITLKVTSSGSYSTGETATLSVGTGTGGWTVTTISNPSSRGFTASSTKPASINNSFGSATYTFTAQDFLAGYGAVFMEWDDASRTISSVTIKAAGAAAADIVCVQRAIIGTTTSLWCCPDAAPIIANGNYDVVVVKSAVGSQLSVFTGTLTNASTTVVTGTATLNGTSASNPITPDTGAPLTISSTGVGVALGYLSGGGATVNSGTQLALSTWFGGTTGNAILSRQTTAGSWTPSFNSTSVSTDYILAVMWG